MDLFSFGKNKKKDELLSAYLDGELEMDDVAEVEERIVMEPASADRLSLLENAAQLADAAMIPPSVPETEAFADRLMACLGKRSSTVEAIQLERPRRLPSTAVLASAGLILTAGVTLVGLRRRGLV